MATVTGFQAVDVDGNPILCQARGNNAAFQCFECRGPILATFLPGHEGSSKNKPCTCLCGCRYWLVADEANQWLVVHAVEDGQEANG